MGRGKGAPVKAGGGGREFEREDCVIFFLEKTVWEEQQPFRCGVPFLIWLLLLYTHFSLPPAPAPAPPPPPPPPPPLLPLLPANGPSPNSTPSSAKTGAEWRRSSPPSWPRCLMRFMALEKKAEDGGAITGHLDYVEDSSSLSPSHLTALNHRCHLLLARYFLIQVVSSCFSVSR